MTQRWEGIFVTDGRRIRGQGLLTNEQGGRQIEDALGMIQTVVRTAVERHGTDMSAVINEIHAALTSLDPVKRTELTKVMDTLTNVQAQARPTKKSN